MGVLEIVLSVIVGIVVLIFLLGVVINNDRKKQIKIWKVGDELLLGKCKEFDILLSNDKEYAKLLGWTLNNLFIDCGDDIVRKVRWTTLEANKSALWRQNYDEAKKIMGVNPGFSSDMMDGEIESTGKHYDGKLIDLMNEIECQVYLKKALKNEDYDVAELIKQRMNNFR